MYPVYLVNIKKEFDAKEFTLKSFAIILLLISLLVFQSVVVEKGIYEGKIGSLIVSSIFPFIGLVGVWIFIVVGILISLLILFEDSDISFNPKKIVPSFKRVDTSIKPKRIENKRKDKREKKRVKEERVLVKNEGDIAEIVIEEVDESSIADIEVDDLNIISLNQLDDSFEDALEKRDGKNFS